MALPTLASIVVMISTNGLMLLNKNSKLRIFYTAGQLFPALNLSSSVLVARFWNAHAGGLSGPSSSTNSTPTSTSTSISRASTGTAESDPATGSTSDPAATHPLLTFLIVFVGLTADLVNFTIVVFAVEGDPRPIFPFIYLPMAVGYTLTTLCFFFSGSRVLRSLSSSNRPVKTMSLYLLLMFTFTSMTIVSFIMVGSNAYQASVEAVFWNVLLYSVGNYGSSLCHLYIFTPKKDTSKKDGFENGFDVTFIETENRVLQENNRAQSEAIARLTKENMIMKENAELESKLLTSSLLEAKTNGKLLKAEKKYLNQRIGNRDSNATAGFLAALREVRNPLNGIDLSLEHISLSQEQISLQVSSGPLSRQVGGPELKDELKNIEACASRQELVLKSAVDLDRFITGNKQLPKETFNPAQLCRDAVAMQSHSARSGVTVAIASKLDDAYFEGPSSQLLLVLMNLLSRAVSFGEDGAVELAANAVEETETHQVLRFAVTDTGKKVPEELQKKFFGRARGGQEVGKAANASERIEGFGFSLFVAHEFVKRMQGALTLRSPVFAREEGRKEGGGGGGIDATAGGGDDDGGGSGCEFSFEIPVRKVGISSPPPVTSSSVMLRHSSKEGSSSPQEQQQVITGWKIYLEEYAERVHTHQRQQQQKQQLLLHRKEEEENKSETDGEVEVEVKEQKLTEGESAKKKKEGEKGAEKEQPYFAGWRVLVVEDSRMSSDLLKRKFCTGPFEEMEWQVETATTAEEALAKIGGVSETKRLFDLAVFDENVAPQGSLLGTAATRILREEDEIMLVIGLTAAATDEVKAESLESGQDLLWLKPMPPAETALKDIMRALAKRRSGTKVTAAGGEAERERVVGRLEEKHEKGVGNGSREGGSFRFSVGAKVAAEE